MDSRLSFESISRRVNITKPYSNYFLHNYWPQFAHSIFLNIN